MQNLQLGDYRGQRDTLQTAMQMQYAPLQNLAQAADTFGSAGMRNAGEQKMEKMKEKFTKQATLDAAMTAEKAATTAYDRSVTTASALADSQIKVTEKANEGRLAVQNATAEHNDQVIAAAEAKRLAQLGAKNKGQIAAHIAAFEAVQRSLGQDHPYYGHVTSTLELLKKLQADEDADRVAGALSGINSNPAEVVAQAERLQVALEAQKQRVLEKKNNEVNNSDDSSLLIHANGAGNVNNTNGEITP